MCLSSTSKSGLIDTTGAALVFRVTIHSCKGNTRRQYKSTSRGNTGIQTAPSFMPKGVGNLKVLVAGIDLHRSPSPIRS